MVRTMVVAVALAAVTYLSASAHAAAWKRHQSKMLGFSMLVPGGAKIVDRAWRGGWAGLQADHKGRTLYGAALLGKKRTATQIRELAEQISGTERKHWTVKKTVKARRGWVWYTIARAVHGEKVVLDVYGLGRKGTYLMLLVTTKNDSRRRKAAHARWTRGVWLN